MNPTTKARLLEKLKNLLGEGQVVMATKFDRSHDNYNDTRDPWVKVQPFRKWLTSCTNLAHQIGRPAKVWIDAFDCSQANQYVVAESLYGALESLHDAVEDDMLSPVEDQVMADAFGSLLDQAEVLLKKGYVLAAGVLCRAVLEEHLRLRCERNSCLPVDRATLNNLNQALYKEGHLDKLAMQSVITMATAGNHCAHNLQPPLSSPDVIKLYGDVKNFLVRHPLP